MDLEVEVAADSDRVAGLPHSSDPLAGPDALAAVHDRGPPQVGVEVAPGFSLAVDFDVVAVEDRVVSRPQDPAGGRRHQLGPAGGGDVESFVRPAAATRR